ncbi:MAG TPA: hypothetical protein ENK29_02535, partial [Chromatiales bacterium]|nr:hypothetical protein [Chromatiales bacterium]
MPQPLTLAQIKQLRDSVNTGGVNAARQVYRQLYDKGYNYAGWALGVANGDSITGVSALNYLDASAMMGLGGDQCRNLSSAEIDKIRVDMATGYLDTLYQIAQKNGGTVARDVKYKETRAFHQQGFVKNGLSLDNWTLNIPMEMIRREYGDQTVEAIWELMRDTGGQGLDAWTYSANMLWYVYLRSDAADPVLRDMARQWLQFFDEGSEYFGPLFDAIGASVNGWFT